MYIQDLHEHGNIDLYNLHALIHIEAETWLVPFVIVFSISRFQTALNLNRFGGSSTRFKFFKFGLRT